MSGFPQKFMEAAAFFNKGLYEKSYLLCIDIVNSGYESSEVFHLMALNVKDYSSKDAFHFFDKALQFNPYNNNARVDYGNYLLKYGFWNKAELVFSECMKFSENKFIGDAIYGVAYANYKKGNYKKAKDTISLAMDYEPEKIRHRTLLSHILLEQNDFEEAFNVVNLDGVNDYNFLIVKCAILRSLNLYDDALNCLSISPDTSESLFMKGCIYYDIGDYRGAEKNLLLSISKNINNVKAHEALNKMYWEHGKLSSFLSSYISAINYANVSLGVYLSYVKYVLMKEDVSLAAEIISQCVEKFGNHHALFHVQGVIEFKKGNLRSAIGFYRKAISQDEINIRYITDLSVSILKYGDFHGATLVLEKANELSPYNQEVLAYLGLCWRITNPEKYNWFFSNSYISVRRLPTPSGYKCFSDFWTELKDAVKKLHNTENYPLDQSVRKGTQTLGNIFLNDIKVIQTYKELLTSHVRSYINELPKKENHPLLVRNSGKFRLSGAWSVKLKDEGFHTNHFHSEGWLSLCTYLNVPESINIQDPLMRGWLKFGETSLALSNNEEINKMVCPEEGLCVIFPSYMWHGTIPFIDNNDRITLACDVVPIDD